MGYKHINDLLLDPGFLLKERVEKLNNIVIKKSETNNNKGVKENVRENVNGKGNVNVNEKVNKVKDIVSKDIKETSTGNRTYCDVCVNGKQETSKKRVEIRHI